MKSIGIVVLAIIALGSGVAMAQESPAARATPDIRTAKNPEAGRYIFYPSQAQRGLEYLLDTTTGDMWVISRDPDTNYVYLGFVPKGPSFTFQDILQQKQQRGGAPLQQ